MAGTLTVLGVPMSASQKKIATAMLTEANQNSATKNVMEALIFAAIMESSIGQSNGSGMASSNNAIGPLQSTSTHWNKFLPPNSLKMLVGQVDAFIQGGPGFRSAAQLDRQFQNKPGLLAAKVEEPVLQDSTLGPSGYGQYFSRVVAGKTGTAAMNLVVGEAVAIVRQFGGGGVTGSTSGTSTGTKSSKTAPFSVGQPANPSEDVWTAINRLAQQRYWYLFSDGETLYLADGSTIMSQPPAVTLDRWGDLDRIVSLSFTWDNTAWQYTHDHQKRRRIVRKTQLAKVTSPVEAELKLICPIDFIRAGDVIQLTGCGPGDGKWLVGDVRRSIFDIYSEITLVPGVRALTEAQAQGSLNVLSNADIPGAAAGASGSGTYIAALDSAAATINGQGYPYVSYGGRALAGKPDTGHPGEGFYDGRTSGFDAAGAIAAVLAAAGLWSGAVPDPQAIVSKLEKEQFLVGGRGGGVPEFSLFLGHGQFFAFINATGKGQYWGSDDGGGASSLSPTPQSNSTSNVVTRFTHGGKPLRRRGPLPHATGGTWLNPPPSLTGYQTYHIPANILGDLINNAALGKLAGTYVNPFGSIPGHNLGLSRVDMGVDYTAPGGSKILAIGDAHVFLAESSGSGWTSGMNTQAFVGYTLSNGPYQGKHIYVAEDLVPKVSTGDVITKGQTIATFIGGGVIETGWATGVSAGPLASSLGQEAGGGDPGAWSSAAGISFARLLKALGCPHGQINGNGQHGKPMPPGYP